MRLSSSGKLLVGAAFVLLLCAVAFGSSYVTSSLNAKEEVVVEKDIYLLCSTDGLVVTRVKVDDWPKFEGTYVDFTMDGERFIMSETCLASHYPGGFGSPK